MAQRQIEGKGGSFGDIIFKNANLDSQRQAPRLQFGPNRSKRSSPASEKLRWLFMTKTGRCALGVTMLYGATTPPGQDVQEALYQGACGKIEVPKACDKALYDMPPKPIESAAQFPSTLDPGKRLKGIAEYVIIADNPNSFVMTTVPRPNTNIPQITSIGVLVGLKVSDKPKLAEIAPDIFSSATKSAVSPGDWAFWMINPKVKADKQALRSSCLEDMNNIVKQARIHAGTLMPPAIAPQMLNGESEYELAASGTQDRFSRVDNPLKANMHVNFIDPGTKKLLKLRCE